MEATSRLEIDLAAIERNVATIRRVCSLSGKALGTGAPPNPRAVSICAVLKADAYSLGAPRIAKRLEIAAVEMLAVFTLDQARALVDVAIRTPILVLQPIRSINRSDPLYLSLAQGRLHLSVHDEDQLEILIQHADRLGSVLPLHLEVNTGMNRGGARPEEAERLVTRIVGHPRLVLAGVYSHFCCADTCPEKTREQHERFSGWLKKVGPVLPRGCVVHHAATYATFRDPALHRDMVRVGLALYGYAGEEMSWPDVHCGAESRAIATELAPAVRWISQIAHLSQIPAGESVGYGATWKASRDSRLALVPVGYADGYPLALSNRGVVGVTIDAPGATRAGVVTGFAPVVGRVSMDQIVIDVTAMPGAGVGVGARVELVGTDRTAPNYLPTLAKAAGTISHDFLCGLSARVSRTYLAVDMSDPSADHRVSEPARPTARV